MGRTEKRLFLKCYDEWICVDETWVEGVGRLNHLYSLPFHRGNIPDGPTYELLCYSENNTTYYINPKYGTCAFDTVIYLSTTTVPDRNLKIYPNPASNHITIETETDESQINLYNSMGVKVLSKENLRDKSIDVSTYPRGIYILQIKTNQQVISEKLFLIQEAP